MPSKNLDHELDALLAGPAGDASASALAKRLPLRFQDQIARNEPIGQEVALLLDVHQRLRERRDSLVSADFADRVFQAIQQDRRQVGRFGSVLESIRDRSRWLAVGMSLALALGLMWFNRGPVEVDSKSETTVAHPLAHNHQETPVGAVVEPVMLASAPLDTAREAMALPRQWLRQVGPLGAYQLASVATVMPTATGLDVSLPRPDLESAGKALTGRLAPIGESASRAFGFLVPQTGALGTEHR